MTFRDVTIKNFMSHMRRYLSYFLCSSFTIMVFFIYATLYFNDSFMKYSKETDFIFMINLGIGTVFLFSIFFINYAHNAFVKSRSKEFALLMTLGLTKKNIGRMIWMENLIILFGSMVFGLLSGALFSRLFFLVISELIEEVPLNYHLDYQSFAVTIIVFIMIYGIAIITSRKSITKLSIIQLLKKSKEVSGSEGRAWIGTFGILLFLGALIMILVMAPREDFVEKSYLYLVYAGSSFLSMYLILTHVGSLYFRYIKRKKKRYYKNLLSFSEMQYSFSQNKKIIFILSILSAMIIFFVASPFALLSISKSIAEESRVADIQFIQLGSINAIEEQELQEILQQGETSFLNEKEQEFLTLSYLVGEEELLKPVISESLYRQLNKEWNTINEGEILELVTTWLPGYQELGGMEEITVYADNISKNFKIAGKVTGAGINIEIFPSKTTLVLNDLDYQRIKNDINDVDIGKVRQFDFENWEKTSSVILALQEKLDNTSEEWPVDSVLSGYKYSRRLYSTMIFFSSFMGMLFFVSAGCILFFKQYGDTEHFKATYKKLSQIGLTKQEIMKIQAKSQKGIFFSPLFFGTIIGFAFVYMTTFLMGGGETIKTFFRYSILIAIIYGVAQVVYYLISMKRFKQSVL